MVLLAGASDLRRVERFPSASRYAPLLRGKDTPILMGVYQPAPSRTVKRRRLRRPRDRRRDEQPYILLCKTPSAPEPRATNHGVPRMATLAKGKLAWRRLPAHDRTLTGQAGGHARRSRCRQCAAHGHGQRLHHRQRLLMDGGKISCGSRSSSPRPPAWQPQVEGRRTRARTRTLDCSDRRREWVPAPP